MLPSLPFPFIFLLSVPPSLFCTILVCALFSLAHYLLDLLGAQAQLQAEQSANIWPPAVSPLTGSQHPYVAHWMPSLAETALIPTSPTPPPPATPAFPLLPPCNQKMPLKALLCFLFGFYLQVLFHSFPSLTL